LVALVPDVAGLVYCVVCWFRFGCCLTFVRVCVWVLYRFIPGWYGLRCAPRVLYGWFIPLLLVHGSLRYLRCGLPDVAVLPAYHLRDVLTLRWFVQRSYTLTFGSVPTLWFTRVPHRLLRALVVTALVPAGYVQLYLAVWLVITVCLPFYGWYPVTTVYVCAARGLLLAVTRTPPVPVTLGLRVYAHGSCLFWFPRVSTLLRFTFIPGWLVSCLRSSPVYHHDCITEPCLVPALALPAAHYAATVSWFGSGSVPSV
jgi:hypothetical protein